MKYSIKHSGYEAVHQKEQITHASGPYIYTQNGRKLLDLCMAAGSQLLGHAHPNIVEAVQKQVALGSIYLANNPYIHELCELLTRALPKEFSNFIFSNSGSEATQKAIRIARLASKKNVIASFEGGWHGSNEWTLHDSGSRFDLSEQALHFGIPNSINADRAILPYNCDSTFEQLDKLKENLAAIIIEPIQGSNPQSEISGFLNQLQNYCNQHNIIIIADEIITGFRTSISGASPTLGFKPDIITYGKSFAGGLPVGLTVINDKVHEDSFGNPKNAVITGGTYSANPLMASAATATLRQLLINDYEIFNSHSEMFKNNLNKTFISSSLPFRIISYGAFLRLAFTDKAFKSRAERDKLELPPKIQVKFKELVNNNGVFWPTNGIILPSFSHGELEFKLAEEAISSSCKKVIEFI